MFIIKIFDDGKFSAQIDQLALLLVGHHVRHLEEPNRNGDCVPLEQRSHSAASRGCTLRTQERCSFYREFFHMKIRGVVNQKKFRTIYGGVPYMACTLYGGSTVLL